MGKRGSFGIITILSLAILLQLFDWTIKETILLKVCQPPEIKYNNNDMFCVKIVKERKLLSASYEVRIFRPQTENVGWTNLHSIAIKDGVINSV